MFWFSEYKLGSPSKRRIETNFAAYLGVGLWHYYLVTEDKGFLKEQSSVVDKAMEFKLGARGLRSICEAIMLEAMFNFPSDSSKKHLNITVSYVNNQLSKLSFSKLKVA